MSGPYSLTAPTAACGRSRSWRGRAWAAARACARPPRVSPRARARPATGRTRRWPATSSARIPRGRECGRRSGDVNLPSRPVCAVRATFEANGRRYRVPDRPVLAICADGWDPEYVDDALARSLMPRLSDALDAGGTYVRATAQVPTFTNPNNVAIVTGVSAARNGI